MVKLFYLTHLETLTGAVTPSQGEPGSKSNEEVFQIPHSSRTEASPSDGFVSYRKSTDFHI